MNWIDAHVHVWTPDTEAYPLAAGFAKADMKPASFTPEELFARCKPEGVARIVLIQMSYYGFDNSYMLRVMELHPGTFSGVAVIDTTAEKPDQEMLRLKKHGVRGFRVRMGKDAERWAETPGLERMFRCAAENGMAICPLMEPSGLPSLSRMCAKHLKTRVVIDHLCRIGVDGEIREKDVHALCLMSHFPEVRVKVSAFYALGKKKPPHDDLLPMIRQVYDAFGARRLMWASDCPFQVVDESYADSISLVRNKLPWLRAADRDRMLRGTAASVFF